MGATQNTVRESGLNGTAEFVSYLGVAPLLLCLLGVGLLPELSGR